MREKKAMDKGIVDVLNDYQHRHIVIDPKSEGLQLVGNKPAGDIIPESGLQTKTAEPLAPLSRRHRAIA